ncbi:unnamed protein product [Victoria cruziana]
MVPAIYCSATVLHTYARLNSTATQCDVKASVDDMEAAYRRLDGTCHDAVASPFMASAPHSLIRNDKTDRKLLVAGLLVIWNGNKCDAAASTNYSRQKIRLERYISRGTIGTKSDLYLPTFCER